MPMTQRLRIEAVHRKTSRHVHASQKPSLSFHSPITSTISARGITKRAISISANARLTMRRLEGVCRRLTMTTEMQTRLLPRRVPVMMRTHVVVMKSCLRRKEDVREGRRGRWEVM